MAMIKFTKFRIVPKPGEPDKKACVWEFPWEGEQMYIAFKIEPGMDFISEDAREYFRVQTMLNMRYRNASNKSKATDGTV